MERRRNIFSAGIPVIYVGWTVLFCTFVFPFYYLFVLHASRFALAVSPQFPSYLVYYYSQDTSEEFAAFLNPPSPPEEARVRR